MKDCDISDLTHSEPVYRHHYRVIYGDTDAAGILYYGNYLRLFEIGRTEYMRHLFGLAYRQMEADGVLLPVTEAYCRYKASARYDDLLEVATSLVQHSKVSIKFYYEITNTDNKKLLARGTTVHASIDRETGRLIRLPRELASAIKGI